MKAMLKKCLLTMKAGFLIKCWHSYLRTYSLWRYRWTHRREFIPAIWDQCRYDKSELHRKTVVVLVLYRKMQVGGGYMSIFNIAATSRKVLGDAAVALCIGPGNPDIYSKNTLFPNNEKVWRWAQVRHSIKHRVKKLILHLPECFVVEFLHNLSRRDKRFLRSVPELRINIMNQNILLMPERKELEGLRAFTDKVTQTTAHAKYNSQEMCDKYCLPTMRIGTYHSYGAYKTYDWDKKEKIIAYSPDRHPMKDEVLGMLRVSCPEYTLMEIRGISFLEYMDLIARAMFVITFGEGLDGYFTQPLRVGTLSFTVYNTDFFTLDPVWKTLQNVFDSYEAMKDKIAGLITTTFASQRAYYSCVGSAVAVLDKGRMTSEQYVGNIKRFYAEDFDYYPRRASFASSI